MEVLTIDNGLSSEKKICRFWKVNIKIILFAKRILPMDEFGGTQLVQLIAS